MKKLVSLLLAVMLVMSMMTFNVMASTDTLVVVTTAEDNIADGNLATSGNQGYSTNGTGNVTVAPIETGSDNKIFSMIKTNGAKYDSSGVLALRVTGDGENQSFFASSMNRFTADVMLPSTVGTTMLFVPRSQWSTAATIETGFGVRLKDGGAYYYDVATGDFISFIDNGTMKADEWYRVEAIMDSREAKLTGNKTYMNAFVYDSTGKLVGTSNWQYVSNVKPYNTHYSFLSVQVQTYGYDEGSIVKIDDFNAYKVTSLPTYSLAGSVTSSVVKNKYVRTPSSGNYRAIADVFNGGAYGTVIQPAEGDVTGTENQAARIEIDVRIPEITSTDVINLFAHYSGNAGLEMPGIYKDGSAQFEGAAHLEGNTLTIRSYDSESATYANNVATATLNENEWYTFTFDSEYSDNSAPTASMTVVDSEGKVVATASNFAAQPIPKSANYNQWVSVMCLVGSAYKYTTIDVDNINYYAAVDMAGLSDVATRTIISEETFENMELGTTLISRFKTKHNVEKLTYWENVAAVTEDTVVWEEGMVLKNTDPLSLTFTYSNPVPVSVLTKDNIEFYANGVKMSTGYTITPGTTDANNCTTTFTVATGVLDWGTDYVIRVKAAVVDYNTALSGGVPAEPGLYKDITFSVAGLVPDCEIESEFVEGAGTVGAKVTFNSNEDSPLTCYAILAVYEGNKLVGLKKSAEITVPANAENYEATVEATALPAGAKAKIFVWNNFETMRPWVSPIVLGE